MKHCPGCNCERTCKCGQYEVQESSDYPGFRVRVSVWFSTDGVGWDNVEDHSPTLCTKQIPVEIEPQDTYDLKDGHGYSDSMNL